MWCFRTRRWTVYHPGNLLQRKQQLRTTINKYVIFNNCWTVDKTEPDCDKTYDGNSYRTASAIMRKQHVITLHNANTHMNT